MASELRIELHGERAVLGEIPARDVANLILSVELAVMRAASVVLGRPKTTTGRGESVVEEAARLRLRAVEEGSVAPVFELPEDLGQEEGALDVSEISTLSEMAVGNLLDVAEAGNGHPVVAAALVEMASRLGVGTRYDTVRFNFAGLLQRPKHSRVVDFDAASASRLRRSLERNAPRVREDSVVGVLVEADFEKNTARLRGPMGEAVTVSFDDELADDIQEALRRPLTFEGKIVYDPETFVARTVQLSRIVRGRQLVLGVDEEMFWAERSFADLATEQGVHESIDPEDLFDAGASDEEREAFMAALAELRS